MPKYRDTEQVISVARQYRMTEEQIWEFSKLIHDYKEEGFRGNKNERRDFTYQELCQFAQELLEDQG